MYIYQEHGTPMPFLERRFGEPAVLHDIEDLALREKPTIELAECAYHMGYLEEAVPALRAVEREGNLLERMVALALEVNAHLGRADGASARECTERAVAAAREGFFHPDDPAVFGTSLVCAYILEHTTLTRMEGKPPFLGELGDLGDLPRGLQAYCGYQMAFESLMKHEYWQAIGLAQGFLASASGRYPVSCAKLNLIIASAHLHLRQPAKARASFFQAWELAHPLGIIMPFVELSAYTPALARHCLHEEDETSYLAIRTMVQRYRLGWHDLKRRMGSPMLGEELSPLEYGAIALAAWGWPNRDIAQYLGIAESTVKHYLTSSYQKLGVKNRAALAAAAKRDPFEGDRL